MKLHIKLDADEMIPDELKSVLDKPVTNLNQVTISTPDKPSRIARLIQL